MSSVSTAKAGPRRLAHANMSVRNQQPSVAFYGDICGLHAVYDEAPLRATFLSNGSSHHDLLLVEAPEHRLNHLGWEMETEADLVDALEMIENLGLEVQRTTDHEITHSMYVVDPEGNQMEYYADAMHDWRGWYESIDELKSVPWDPASATPSGQPLYDPDPRLEPRHAAVFPALQLHRAVLVVSDLSQTVPFYEGVGMLRTAYHAGLGVAVLGGTLRGTDLGLVESRGRWAPGLGKLCFRIADEDSIERGLATLIKRGSEPEGNVDDARKRSVLLRDPDGALVEVLVERTSIRTLEALSESEDLLRDF